MILAFLFTFLINSVKVIMDMIGVPKVTVLPGLMDSSLSQAFGMVYAVWDDLWPVQALVVGFIAYLGVKIVMLLLQFWLGSRISHG